MSREVNQYKTMPIDYVFALTTKLKRGKKEKSRKAKDSKVGKVENERSVRLNVYRT